MMHRLHRQRGTTLPETAIIVGVLLALVFGIFEFGRALYTYNKVADMARKGARWAMVRGSQCTLLTDNPKGYTTCPTDGPGILAYVKSIAGPGLDQNAISVDGGTTSGSYGSPIWLGKDATGILCGNAGQGTGGGNNVGGCAVIVKVSYPFSFILPYLPQGGSQTCGAGAAPSVMNFCISSTSKMNIAQ